MSTLVNVMTLFNLSYNTKGIEQENVGCLSPFISHWYTLWRRHVADAGGVHLSWSLRMTTRKSWSKGILSCFALFCPPKVLSMLSLVFSCPPATEPKEARQICSSPYATGSIFSAPAFWYRDNLFSQNLPMGEVDFKRMRQAAVSLLIENDFFHDTSQLTYIMISCFPR